MATWITHLRIADRLLNSMPIKNDIEFIVGNIGPDCGVPNEDWSRFDPPGEVSHWRLVDKAIDYKAFYKEHCINRTSDFYLGYYVHLLTDFLWAEIVYQRKRRQYEKELKADRNFIWTMKEDWYDLDKKFLNENNLPAYNEFIQIKEFKNRYLDFYSENAFSSKIKFITEFYESRDRKLNRDFAYLTEKEMDDFVDEGYARIIEDLSCLGET
ncbi:MAG: zinc dependent phospholipase C family protein [Spirochaetales bacterium]|nr:zinc dependent phospholipase C family protein [Spirochaetales bacterium]